MKFDVVVGNPPYQEDSGTSARDDAIYPYFYNLAKKISSKYCLISPARFLFNAGSTNKAWNKEMLSDRYLKVVYFNQTSAEVFPSTNIMGGVAVIYRDEECVFGEIDTFTSFPELQGVLNKVTKHSNFKSIEDNITGRGAYKLTDLAHQEYPQIENLQSKGHKNDVGSGAFKVLKDVVIFDDMPNDDNEYVKILGLENMKRVYKFIRIDFINRPYGFEKYKIMIPKANGSKPIGSIANTSVIGAPLVGKPQVGFTETFISIGAFDTNSEAQNALKYIKSKFARTLLGILKITQDNPRDKWSKVPLQNFTPNSDIDWSKSISEIDQQLYKKYDLSESEIDFIETKVKAMD